MIAVNYIVLAFLAIAFIVLGIGFLLLITKNMRQGRVVRQHLARRVETLRMSRMLKALGLDFSKYLHTVPISKINDSMNRCETCDTTDECDTRLTESSINIDNIEFCPNQECLQQLVELEKQKSEQPL